MKKKDRDYLISAGILIFVGWFIAGFVCYGLAWYFCNKVEEKSTVRTILKVLSIVGLVVMAANLFAN